MNNHIHFSARVVIEGNTGLTVLSGQRSVSVSTVSHLIFQQKIPCHIIFNTCPIFIENLSIDSLSTFDFRSISGSDQRCPSHPCNITCAANLRSAPIDSVACVYCTSPINLICTSPVPPISHFSLMRGRRKSNKLFKMDVTVTYAHHNSIVNQMSSRI